MRHAPFVRTAVAIVAASVLAASPARACAPADPADARVATCLAAVLDTGYPENTNAGSGFHACDEAAAVLVNCAPPEPTLNDAYVLLGAAFYHTTDDTDGPDPQGDRYFNAGIAVADALLEAERRGPDPEAHDEALAPLRYLIQRVR